MTATASASASPQEKPVMDWNAQTTKARWDFGGRGARGANFSNQLFVPRESPVSTDSGRHSGPNALSVPLARYQNYALELNSTVRQAERKYDKSKVSNERGVRLGKNQSQSNNRLVRSTIVSDRGRVTGVMLPGQVSPLYTSREASRRDSRTTYTTDAGPSRSLSRGVSLDLSSDKANISVGDILDGSSVTISIGDGVKEISAGSKVTAAEYAALSNILADGKQGLTLRSDGTADGGTLNLNSINNDGRTIRASTLVIPEGVSAVGDFARASDGLRVKNDLVNFGSITALSSNDKGIAQIAARNVSNGASGIITTVNSGSDQNDLDLSVRASRDLMNGGTISSSGALDISAGHAFANSGTATSIKSMVVSAPTILNTGAISSTNQNVVLAGASDAVLIVNNSGGTISARQGSVFIRSEDYTGSSNSEVFGGDFLSQKLIVNSGYGVAHVRANDVTGEVISSGEALHFSANTETLKLGTQCLTGDPTYFNTGNIVITGDINVGEDLAIISGGSITTTASDLAITARTVAGAGCNINIIAGANIIAGTGPTGTLPPFDGATGNVTIDNAGLGGDIDFSSANTVTINSNATAPNQIGGSVTIAAYGDSAGTVGNILLPTAAIDASGSAGQANGDVTIVAGSKAGQLVIGSITTNGGSTGGNVVLHNARPIIQSGSSLTFAPNGKIIAGLRIGSNGAIESGSSISVGAINARQNVTLKAGSDAVLSGGITAGQKLVVQAGSSIVIENALTAATGVDIKSSGTIDLQTGAGDITSGADLITYSSGDSNFGGQLTANYARLNSGANLSLQGLSATRSITTATGNIALAGAVGVPAGLIIVAGGDITTGSTSLDLTTNSSGNAGSMTVVAGALWSEQSLSLTVTGPSVSGGNIDFSTGAAVTNISSSSIGLNGNAGQINLIAYKGSITIPGITITASGDGIADGNGHGANGSVRIVAPEGIDLSDIELAGTRFGTVQIFGKTPGSNVAINTSFTNSFGRVDTSGFLIGTAGTGSVTVGDIKNSAGSVRINSSTNAITGNIDVSTTSTNGGSIVIETKGSSTLLIGGLTGPNRTGLLNVSVGAVGDGGGVSITESNSGITIGAGSIISSVTSGDGVSLSLQAPNGNLDVSSLGASINVDAAGAGNIGGTIILTGTTITGAPGPLALSAVGDSVGSIFVKTTTLGATGNLVVGTGAGEISAKVGANGTISFEAGGSVTVKSGSALSGNQVRLFSQDDVAGGISILSDISTSSFLTLEAHGSGGIETLNGAVLSAGILLVDHTGSGATNIHTKANSINFDTIGSLNIQNDSDISLNGTTHSSSLTLLQAANKNVNFSNAVLANGGITVTVSGTGGITTSANLEIQTAAPLIVNAESGAVKINTKVQNFIGTSTGAMRVTQFGDFNVTGGTYKDLNINNISGSTHVTGNIEASSIVLTSMFDVNLNADLTANNGITVVANRNISTTDSALRIDATSGLGDGGNIVIMAGAAYTNGTTDVKINGASTTGGSVDLSSGSGELEFLSSTSSMVGGSGGNITLVAFTAAAGNQGRVLLPTAVTLTTSGNGNSSGFVTIVGGATDSSDSIRVGSIDTSFGTNDTGVITLASAKPNVSSTGAIVAVGGDYLGTFTSPNLTSGKITAATLTTAGADISVNTSGDLTLSNIKASATSDGFSGGQIKVAANKNLSIPDVESNGFGSGAGGSITIGGGSTSLLLGPINADGGATGDGGKVSISSSLNTVTLNTISAVSGGFGGNGGSISVNSVGDLTVLPGNFDVSVIGNHAGNGGALQIKSSFGKIIFSDSTILDSSAPFGGASGKGGSIIISGKSIEAMGDLTLKATNLDASSGTVSITTTEGNFNTNGNNLTIVAGGQVTLDVKSQVLNSGKTFYGAGDINISGKTIAAGTTNFIAIGEGIENGGNVTINGGVSVAIGSINASAMGGAGDGGNILVSAGSSSITANGSYASTSVDNDGGDITLTAGGALTFTGTSSSNSADIDVNGMQHNGSVLLEGANISVTAKNGLHIVADKGPVGGTATINTSASGGLSTSGNALSISANDSILLNGIGAKGINTRGSANGGAVALTTHGLGDFSSTLIDTQGTGNGDGGDVTITLLAGGIFNVGAIDTTAPGAGRAGDITLDYPGDNGFVLAGNLTADSSATGTAGDISINTVQPLLTVGINISAKGGGATGSVSLTNLNSIQIDGQITAGSITVTSGIVGNIIVNGKLTGSGAITLDSGITITQGASAIIEGGDLSISYEAGTVNLDTSVSSLAVNAVGLNANIQNEGAIILDALSLNSLSLTAASGDISTSMASTLSGDLILVSQNGAINIENNLTVSDKLSLSATNGDINIDASVGSTSTAGRIDFTITGGNIVQTAGVISTNKQSVDGLTVSMSGSANATLDGNNNVKILNSIGSGSGDVVFHNGDNALQIGTVGSNLNLTISTTDTVSGIEITSDATTTGNLLFNAPRFFNDKDVTAASIVISNPNGSLTVVGGAPGEGRLTGTTPAPSNNPGLPSSPSSVTLQAQSNSQLILQGDMEISGDASFNSPMGFIISEDGSLFHSTNNIALNTGVWSKNGTGDIVANLLIFDATTASTLVSTGDLNLTSNIVVHGHDFAILAGGDINIGDGVKIDLSNVAGDGGDLTILAGYDFSPDANGLDSQPFTLGAATSGDVNASGSSIVTSSGSVGGTAGSVLIAAPSPSFANETLSIFIPNCCSLLSNMRSLSRFPSSMLIGTALHVFRKLLSDESIPKFI